ncbi:TetR/AcrR family transcriptional regulator [Paenibacillus sp. TRM 82003]|uniref:TetR/AcrR family transcriptional regulator n=1 Tax=Kineococcus sp. TRM81007 TaxID=2925831 RepID=UPI001F59C695|nr:TetR/AcrR family transcriptional regulator [Kineococcus sp. TRM81007]MCI2240416.1 TetR/AcrR family transcriptional regulator [Kineococcus sp. TRM81007]MCI3927408.1 TetR/AcrR family transcriptional regulator [Paenibacillus sp. TRM 82003]
MTAHDQAAAPAATRRSGGKRGPYAKTAGRREEILDAAFDVFAQQGLRGSSLREIAERVGVSHTSLLHHFGSKDQLLIAVLQRRREVQTPVIERLMSERGVMDAVVENVRESATTRGIVALHTTVAAESTDPDHPANLFFREHYHGYAQTISAGIARDQALGRLRDDVAPLVVARQLSALLDGLQVQWLLDPDLDMVAEVEAFAALLLPR